MTSLRHLRGTTTWRSLLASNRDSPELRHAVLRDSHTERRGVEAIRAVFEAGAATVNVRTFKPGAQKGNPFVYGISTSPRRSALSEDSLPKATTLSLTRR